MDYLREFYDSFDVDLSAPDASTLNSPYVISVTVVFLIVAVVYAIWTRIPEPDFGKKLKLDWEEAIKDEKEREKLYGLLEGGKAVIIIKADAGVDGGNDDPRKSYYEWLFRIYHIPFQIYTASAKTSVRVPSVIYKSQWIGHERLSTDLISEDEAYQGLEGRQQAVGTGIVRMIHEHTQYLCMSLLPDKYLTSSLKRTLYLHGVSRLSAPQKKLFLTQDLKSLEALCKYEPSTTEVNWFMTRDVPCLVDAAVLGLMTSFDEWEEIKTALEECPRLVEYVRDMRAKWSNEE